MKILHLEDNLRDAELAREMLLAEWPDCVITLVATREAFLAELESGNPDIVLSDFQLPGFNGLEALELTRMRAPHVPFIFFSGTIGEERAIEAVRAGAADYVIKDRMQRLPVSILRVMREAEELRARRRIEDALAQEQYLLLMLMENLPDHVYFKDLNSRFITVSRSMARRLRLAPNEVKGKTDFDVFSEEHARQAFADEQRIIRSGEPMLDIEEKETWPDGSITWVLTSKLPLRDAAGKIVGTFGVSREITDRKKAEEAMRNSERRFRALIERSADAIAVIDATNQILYHSPSVQRVEGYAPEELAGHNGLELTHPDDRDLIRAYVDELLKQPGVPLPVLWRRRHKDGRWLWLEGTATNLLHDPAVKGIVTNYRDVTEKKLADEHIREQAEIIDQTPLGIFISDLTHRVTYCNQGALAVFGLPREKIIGHPGEDFLTPETMDRIRLAREATLATGRWSGEIAVHTRGGRQVPAEFHMSIINDSTGRPRARLTIVLDLTEKKKIEAQFLRAQRLESLGMLSAGIAHDLNNILAPVLMGAPLLRIRVTNPADLRVLDTIEKSAGRGAGLVRQILSFAHGASGERLLIQVKHLLNDISNLIKETFPKHIKLVDEVPNNLWTIRGNPTQLHQVLLNLCVNARDAMPQGGILRLRAENRQLDKVPAQANPDATPGAYLVIEVGDTGTGISPEVLARIWEPFFSTKGEGKGTGLGLVTVRGIATSHGGFVTVDSVVGRGTSFHVFLPATAQTAAPPAAAGATFQYRGRGELVLVADDEASIRELLTAYLSRYGYRVIAAANGIEAVALYSNRMTEIALVMTDLGMPEMGGVELASVLARMNPKVKIIFMSGADGDTSQGKPLPTNARVLRKPFLGDSLLSIVNDTLGDQPAKPTTS
ncbi:MAG TPA: PAS domain S-box protein [Lacunisphaera sp.]|nr:PAS domain S-box protein [Lacunisphaera sp.]